MKHLPRRLSWSVAAFTLIELLTVITIIAILMGLLFPVISIVRDHANKTAARNTAAQVAAAVKQYYTEYAKFPVADYAGTNPIDVKLGDRTKAGAMASNAELFNILRAKNEGKNTDNALNPRRVTFFTGKPVSDPNAPKNGFLDSPAGKGNVGALYDPWGQEFTIVMDANYNDVINISDTYSDFVVRSQEGNDTGVQVTVGVFSLGKDGEIGSPRDGITGMYRAGSRVSDDIVSWQ